MFLKLHSRPCVQVCQFFDKVLRHCFGKTRNNSFSLSINETPHFNMFSFQLSLQLSGRCREVGDSGVNSEVNPQHHDVFDIEEGQIVSEDCKLYRQRIMESLEKMEKRRERFEKQPIINVERDKCLKTNEIFVETPQPNRDRPVRKRRWC